MNINDPSLNAPSITSKDIHRRTSAVVDTLYRKKQRLKIMHPSVPSNADLDMGVKLSPDNPPISPYECGDQCSVCFSQFFPAVGSIGDKAAKSLTDPLVTSIHSYMSYLLQRLSEQGDHIVTKWMKMTRTKRFQFLKKNTNLYDKKWAPIHLLDAIRPPELNAPGSGLFKSHRHPTDTLSAAATSHNRSATREYQQTWVLPYLNIEMLAEDPSLLLGLLHLRTSVGVGGWRIFDSSQLHLAEDLSIVTPLFNRNCVVMEGPDFGKFVPWSYEGMHRHTISGFPQARLMLTAEKTMLELLHGFVSGLLDGIAVLEMPARQTKWPDSVKICFQDMESKLGWPKGTIDSVQRPVFGPNHLVNIIRSRHREAKDHIELLQTDPEYFQLHAREMSSAFAFEGEDEDVKWTSIADDLVFEAIRRECFWRQLGMEADIMETSFAAFLKSFLLQSQDTDDLRDSFHLTVYWLQDYCVSFFAHMRLRLETSITTSRGFEGSFEYVRNDKPGRLHKSPLLIGDCFHQDVLFWSLLNVCYDNYRTYEMHPTFNFAIIDDVCRNNSKDAERMSQRTRDLVDDMSVLCDMVSHVEIQRIRDRASIPSKFWKLKATDVSQRCFLLKFDRLIDLPLGQKMGSLLAVHLQKACRVPWPRGPRTQRWLEQATAARDTLGALWQNARTIWSAELEHAKLPKHEIDADMAILSEAQSERTKTRLATEEQAIVQEKSRKERLNESGGGEFLPFENSLESVSNMSRTKFTSHHENEGPSEVSLGSNASSEALIEPRRFGSIPGPSTASILVHRESLKLFHHMFPTIQEEGQRSFSWQHFISAMADAGLTVSQSHGSAVTLKIQTSESQAARSIVVHRPHPRSTVNPVMLRAIGKRTARWFGWKRDVFAELRK